MPYRRRRTGWDCNGGASTPSDSRLVPVGAHRPGQAAASSSHGIAPCQAVRNSLASKRVKVDVGGDGHLSDAEVITASLLDPSRFGLIVDAYATPISRYLAKRVGPVLAQDLTSETFLQAFRGRRTYRADQPNALPWLYGIATNQVRAHVRSEQRRLEVLDQLGGQVAPTTVVHENVDDALAAAAIVQHLAGAFARLAGTARDVLALVGVEGLSYEDTAAALGIPVGTVRSRLSRARQELRRSLVEEELRLAAGAAPSEGTCHG